MVYYSVFDIEGNLTFFNYVRLFEPVYLKMILSSFWYAFLITFFSFIISFPTAYFLTKTKNSQLWILLIILPTWLNLLLKAYAFIGIFSEKGSLNQFLAFIGVGNKQIMFTKFSFIFVGVYIFIPFMILPIYNSIKKIDKSLIYAAADLGATSWRIFHKVMFPLAIAGVRVGVIAVFIPTLSLFMLVRLIAGNRIMTMGTAIEQHFLITEDWGMGATLAVFLMFVMIAIVFFLNNHRKVRGRE